MESTTPRKVFSTISGDELMKLRFVSTPVLWKGMGNCAKSARLVNPRLFSGAAKVYPRWVAATVSLSSAWLRTDSSPSTRKVIPSRFVAKPEYARANVINIHLPRATNMAASRSLNDPVVIVTLVKLCAALAGCIAIVAGRTNEMKKLKSFVFIRSSDDWASVERSDVNEIVQCRQAGVAC